MLSNDDVVYANKKLRDFIDLPAEYKQVLSTKVSGSEKTVGLLMNDLVEGIEERVGEKITVKKMISKVDDVDYACLHVK